MNTRTFSALLVASTLSFGALAQGTPPAFKHESIGVAKTRAEVVTELQQARQAGTSYLWNDSNLPVAQANATPRTRTEVLAELRQAQADGTYALLHSDSPIAPGNALQRQNAKTDGRVAGKPVQGDAH